MQAAGCTEATLDNSWTWIHPSVNSYNFTFQDSVLGWSNSIGATAHFASLIYGKDTEASPDPTKPDITTVPAYVTGGTTATQRKSLLISHVQYVANHYKNLHGAGPWIISIGNEFCETSSANNYVERMRPSWLTTIDPNWPSLVLSTYKAIDPAATFIITDNTLEYRTDKYPWCERRRSWMLAYAKSIGVGIGIQAHLDDAPIKAGYLVLAKFIDDIHAAGLKAYITEADIGNGTPASWGELAKQSAKADGFFFWGLTDQFSWRKGQHATLFNNDFTPTASLQAWKDGMAPPPPAVVWPQSFPVNIPIPGGPTYSGTVSKQ